MTPTQLIAAVRVWSAHVITQPSDPMRAKVDAVLAAAKLSRVQMTMLSRYRTGRHPGEKLLDEYNRAAEELDTALLAAGVEVENG